MLTGLIDALFVMTEIFRKDGEHGNFRLPPTVVFVPIGFEIVIIHDDLINMDLEKKGSCGCIRSYYQRRCKSRNSVDNVG